MQSERIDDRMLRLHYLKALLGFANTAWLYGNPADVELFRSYLEEYTCEGNKARILDFNTSYNCSQDDIFFILSKNASQCHDIIKQLIDQGVAPLQIIPPSCFWLQALAEKKGFIGDATKNEFQLPFLATIDTVNACNLDCVTCGRLPAFETNDRMSFGVFVKCLDKLQVMGVQQVELYNFTEPFLHPQIYDFMAEVKRRGLTLGISTNLSLPNIPRLKECVDLLRQGDWFVVTISGLRQEIYEINHRRGKIVNVLENLKEIAKSPHKQNVRLRMLRFSYNDMEKPAAEALAKQLGVAFEWFPASGDPLTNVTAEQRKKRNKQIEEGLSIATYSASYNNEGFYCRFIHSRNIVINCKGNVELCCMYVTRPYDLGSFLDQDIGIIQLKRDRHPLCTICDKNHKELSQRLANVIPQDVNKINHLLTYAMRTFGTMRALEPMNFYNGIMGTQEFLKQSVNYFMAHHRMN